MGASPRSASQGADMITARPCPCGSRSPERWGPDTNPSSSTVKALAGLRGNAVCLSLTFICLGTVHSLRPQDRSSGNCLPLDELMQLEAVGIDQHTWHVMPTQLRIFPPFLLKRTGKREAVCSRSTSPPGRVAPGGRQSRASHRPSETATAGQQTAQPGAPVLLPKPCTES